MLGHKITFSFFYPGLSAMSHSPVAVARLILLTSGMRSFRTYETGKQFLWEEQEKLSEMDYRENGEKKRQTAKVQNETPAESGELKNMSDSYSNFVHLHIFTRVTVKVIPYTATF